MNKILLFITILFAAIAAKAESYIETYNILSDNCVNEIQDAQVIRFINGGTVITPVFDESCPEILKAPFSYACKIVEEYMPPCLPLKVAVSCGRLNGSAKGAVSKVSSNYKENFGDNVKYKIAQMSMVKGVILSELCHGSSVSYLDSVPDINFLIEDPDIKITYNEEMLDEISFLLDAEPGQNFDFVSLAVRDLLIGLGVSTDFRYIASLGELQNPLRNITPFESLVSNALGTDNRFAKATSGEVIVRADNINLKLYAPNPWKKGISLNYFISQEGICLTNILRYDFCKGMVTRSLSDNYSKTIFMKLLGWIPDFTVSNSTPSSSASGSTSLLMPYNGSITFEDDTYGTSYISSSSNSYKATALDDTDDTDDKYELLQYVNSFLPFLYNEKSEPSSGTSVSILKKDGTWDLVQFISYAVPAEYPFSMSSWTFNYDNEEYARTIEGYLRARITTKETVDYGRSIYKSTYFVVDYLPQKVNLRYEVIDSSTRRYSSSASSNNMSVRIYFGDTEGVDRIIIERLRQGSRVPSKITVTDLNKGYIETTVDRASTFTAIAYNGNGSTRGVPITIVPVTNEASVSIQVKNNCISVLSEELTEKSYQYSIIPLDCNSRQILLSGSTEGNIDISSLPEGLYVLQITDISENMTKSFKFKK